MLLVEVPATLLPFSSWAGVKRKRRWARLQAVLSSAELPLDRATVQPVTLPSGPIVIRMVVVPCASARMAEAG